MVTVEKTKESDVYIFHEGTEDEIRLKWEHADDGLPRSRPPFMLEEDILSYVEETESVLNITKGDSLDIVEKRFRGLNNALARIVNENEGYVCDVECNGCDIGNEVYEECGRMLREGGIESSECKTLETLLPAIRNLVDCQFGYTMVYGNVFRVCGWWLQEGKYGLFPGVAVLYVLWFYLNKYVEETNSLFKNIGHKVENIDLADVASRVERRIRDGEEIMQSELSRAEYTVTGIRYQMEGSTFEEKTAAAERFVSSLSKGQKVILAAEPDNPIDEKAIAVYIDYRRIGYIISDNTDEVSKLLDNNGQCEGVIERTDAHITFFITIPGATDETNIEQKQTRQLPVSPLGESVQMPFSNDENRLRVIAVQLLKTKLNYKNTKEFINLAEQYITLMKPSVCYEDATWRDKVSKKLHKIIQSDHRRFFWNISEEDLAKINKIYKEIKKNIGNQRQSIRQRPEQIFGEHLNRLRNDVEINKYLYQKYCDVHLGGKDFANADKTLICSEYERLCNWMKGMRWSELRDPDNLAAMGTRVNYLRLSRRELYDLYSVLLLLERLYAVLPSSKTDIPQPYKHFNKQVTYDELKSVYDGLMKNKMFCDNPSLVDFIYWHTGSGTPPTLPLKWETKNVCRYYVQRYLDSQWDIAESCFACKKGSIDNLGSATNITPENTKIIDDILSNARKKSTK